MSESLLSIVKTATATKSERDKFYPVAHKIALDEACLSNKELSDLWNEFSYMIDSRTGRPYNHTPLALPRFLYEDERGREIHEDDYITIENCPFEFYRTEFYGEQEFQKAVKAHYRKLGHSVGFISKRRGYVLKIYMF
jgi:hypothetical protein